MSVQFMLAESLSCEFSGQQLQVLRAMFACFFVFRGIVCRGRRMIASCGKARQAL